MINPEEVYKQLTATGEEWADRLAAADVLEASLKTLKAQLAVAEREDGCSMTEAEARAAASPDYDTAHRNAIEARRQANRARVRYKATEALFEARRTEAATQRVIQGRAAP